MQGIKVYTARLALVIIFLVSCTSKNTPVSANPLPQLTQPGTQTPLPGEAIGRNLLPSLTPSPVRFQTPTQTPHGTSSVTTIPTRMPITADNLPGLSVIYALAHPSTKVLDVTFSPDNTLLATSSSDGNVRLWRVKDGKLLFTLKGHTEIVQSIAFSPDGKLLASGSDDQTVRLWQVADGTLVKSLDASLIGRVIKVEFSRDGSLIAMAGDLCFIMLRNSSTGALRKSFKQPGCFAQNGGTVKYWGLAFTPNNKTLISGEGQPGGDGNSIQRWDIDSYTEPVLVRGYDLVVRDLSLSPDGNTLAVALVGSPEIWLLNAFDGTILRKLSGHIFRINSVRYSPDGKLLVSAGRDNTVLLWDSVTGILLSTLSGHTEAVNSLSISQDGSMVVSGSDDGTAIVWGLLKP